MYRPTIRSNFWLGVMAVCFIVLYYWTENSRETIRTADYTVKKTAGMIAAEALEVLQNNRLPGDAEQQEGLSDPLIFTMLGEKDSPITTDEGRIEDKITVLNPNFAALVVDMLGEAGVSKGDTVAVMLTGSLPGANIAVYSAARALDLHLVVITSVGSSWWGANSPDFTWLDMESVLERLFVYKSLAASAGGSDDNGGLRLSDLGRSLIQEAVDRHAITYIHEGSLSENIKARVKSFSRVLPLRRYKAVINVGGGVAALGHRENSRLIPSGVNRHLPVKNYPNRGVIHHFSDAGVPVINVYNVSELARKYGLGVSQLPLPTVGTGRIYEHQRHNRSVAITCLVLMLGILVVIKYLDYKYYKWREERITSDKV